MKSNNARSESTVNESHLQRLLNYLVAFGIFSCSTKVDDDQPEVGAVGAAAAADSDNLQYGLTVVSNLLVTKNNPSSQAPLLLLQTSDAALAPWAHLHGSVFDKNPCRTAHGKNVWEYARDNPKFNRTVNAAMATHGAMVSFGLHKYQGFQHIKTLVDVAGGVGKALGVLVSAYPHIHGINFDLPHVVADAPNIPGVEHVGGNMFESIPSGDAIFIKFVLHNWGDDDCIKVLKNCKKALPENGKVLIYELVLKHQTRQFAQTMDIVMLTQFESGLERTEQPWRILITAAGFSTIKFIELILEHCLIEVSK